MRSVELSVGAGSGRAVNCPDNSLGVVMGSFAFKYSGQAEPGRNIGKWGAAFLPRASTVFGEMRDPATRGYDAGLCR